MYRYIIILIILLVSAHSIKAQNRRTNTSQNKPDSISAPDTARMRKIISEKENIQLNNDIKNNIDFNFFGNKPSINESPYLESSKKWMRFNDDASKSIMYPPKNPNDMRITMQINPNSHTDFYDQSDIDIRNRRIPAPTGEGDAMQIGTGVSFAFDAEKLLYENLTERGRLLKHNRKYANAWKNYKDFIPDKDSIQRDSTLLMQDILRIANDLVPLSSDTVK